MLALKTRNGSRNRAVPGQRQAAADREVRFAQPPVRGCVGESRVSHAITSGFPGASASTIVQRPSRGPRFTVLESRRLPTRDYRLSWRERQHGLDRVCLLGGLLTIALDTREPSATPPG